MLDETQIKAVGRHGMVHQMGMCTCPCYDALIAVAANVARERKLVATFAAVAPEVLPWLLAPDDAPKDEP